MGSSAGHAEFSFTGLYLGELSSAMQSADLHTPAGIVRWASGVAQDRISSEGTCKEVSLGGDVWRRPTPKLPSRCALCEHA